MKYYFLHIPKTGGVSLYKSVLWKPFKEERIITSFKYNKEFNIFSGLFERVQRECYIEKSHPGIVIKRYNIPDFDLMAVHTGYGIHEGFSGDFKYLTIIRNPKTHIVSHLTTLWHMQPDFRLLPSEVVDSKHLLFDNYQTRYLVKDGFYVDKITNKHTKQALENLKNFWVGTTNKLNQFIIELSSKFNVSTEFRHDNRTELGRPVITLNKNFECVPHFTDEVMDKLLLKNFSDVELYNYANSL